MSVPAVAVAGAVLVSERSVTADTWVVAVAVLLAWLLSVSLAGTVAVFVTGPVTSGWMWTVMEKLWLAPGASGPTLQVTVPAALLHPAEAETKVTCAGSTSVMVEPVDVDG